MSTHASLSIVIPTCGRPAILDDVLSALFTQTFDVRGMEILVVVDGGDPTTMARVRERAACAPCRLEAIPQPRSGQGIARNLGVRRAAGRTILMLDDDIIAVPGLVQAHADCHDGVDDLVVTGPVPLEPHAHEPAHHRETRRWWENELKAKASPAHRPSFRDFTTGNVSVSRRRLLEAGGFDSIFTGYGREDYELGHRLLRAGLRFVYEPGAIGLHRYRKPLLAWLRQWRDIGHADVLFARKHPEIARDVMALSSVPTVRWSPVTVGLAERVAAALNHRGGSMWRNAAGYAMAAHYWRGVHEEVQSMAELVQLGLLAEDARRRNRPVPALARFRHRLLNHARRARAAWTS